MSRPLLVGPHLNTITNFTVTPPGIIYLHRPRKQPPKQKQQRRREREKDTHRERKREREVGLGVQYLCFILGYKITNGACHKEQCGQGSTQNALTWTIHVFLIPLTET